MKLKPLFVLLLLLLIGSISLNASVNFTAAQDDTVLAKEALTPPIIDGKADDACWADATWQAIDQVWITWGEKMDAADFTGQYKVCWSSETDRLYFLVEVVDDVLVDGYKYPMDGYYNWDVVEIFFDEDASGGDHRLDQNAFAYHITAGNDEVEFEAMDLAANWAAVNYSDHLDCQIEFVDGKYIWEISMIVYNENYNPNKTDNPTEQLVAGKVSGLSIAYCDNDDPNEEPKSRDNFIGSVAVPQANYNDHWMNADWFGKLKLVPATFVQDQSGAPQDFALLQNYPNPFNPNTTISFQLPANADVQLDIYNTLGQKVRTLTDATLPAGAHSAHWDGLNDAGQVVNSGLYLYQLKAVTANGLFQQTQKMILAR
jgi:hypothetical protein